MGLTVTIEIQGKVARCLFDCYIKQVQGLLYQHSFVSTDYITVYNPSRRKENKTRILIECEDCNNGFDSVSSPVICDIWLQGDPENL